MIIIKISKDINNNNHKKEEYIETEIKEKNYEGNELSKLQLQNFKIENEIEKANFLILKRKEMIKFLKTNFVYPEDDNDSFLFSELKNEKEIENIFNSRKKMQNN